MTISIDVLIAVISFVILSAGFFISRIKDAKESGRFEQRVTVVENMLKEMRDRNRTTDDRVGCHDSDIARVTADLESQGVQLARIEAKLDKLIESKSYEGLR